MKKSVVILILAAALLPAAAPAQERGFGAGVIIGEPTGLSFKKWIGKDTAVDGAAAWSFSNGSFHVHADYLVHNFSLFEVKRGQLGLYYGLGGRVNTEAELRIGFRVPVGLSYLVEGAPIDIFFEVAPLFDLAPSTKLGLSGGIGLRYYF